MSVCARANGDEAIAACSRIIESGKTSGRELAVIYRSRGRAYYGEKDYDRAIADYNAAILCVPKIRFCNIGDEVHRELVVT